MINTKQVREWLTHSKAPGLCSHNLITVLQLIDSLNLPLTKQEFEVSQVKLIRGCLWAVLLQEDYPLYPSLRFSYDDYLDNIKLRYVFNAFFIREKKINLPPASNPEELARTVIRLYGMKINYKDLLGVISSIKEPEVVKPMKKRKIKPEPVIEQVDEPEVEHSTEFSWEQNNVSSVG